MRQRIVRRYSLAFRQQVIAEIESGRFPSVEAARRHYEIGGAHTVLGWLRRLGKNHLLPKVVRVQHIDETDRIAELRARVASLERALGQTQAQNLLNQSYLKIACDQLGEEVETFQKKCAGRPSTTRSNACDLPHDPQHIPPRDPSN